MSPLINHNEVFTYETYHYFIYNWWLIGPLGRVFSFYTLTVCLICINTHVTVINDLLTYLQAAIFQLDSMPKGLRTGIQTSSDERWVWITRQRVSKLLDYFIAEIFLPNGFLVSVVDICHYIEVINVFHWGPMRSNPFTFHCNLRVEWSFVPHMTPP